MERATGDTMAPPGEDDFGLTANRRAKKEEEEGEEKGEEEDEGEGEEEGRGEGEEEK